MWVDNGGFFDGPFAHYEATPDAIEASAVELDRSYGSVEALSSDVDAAHRPALAGLAGDLAGPMAAAPQPVRANGRQVMGAAMVAAGSVRVFGHAVQDFNAGVDALNAQWHDAVASDFGVAPASYPTDASAVQKTRVDEVRADAVLDAKIALLKDLELKYEALRSKLDAKADHSAGQLNEGPTDQVILDLFAAGGLPSTIVGAFPHLQFTMKKLPPDLAEMSDDELADYAVAHPELAASLLPLLDERVKQLIGQDLADRGKGLGNQFDERQEGFKSDIDAFTAALAAYGGDAVVATSFLDTIGPEGLLELNGRVATALYDLPDGYEGGHPDGAGADTQNPGLADSIAAFQKALGVTLAAGTSGQPTTVHDWNGDGSSTYVSADWVDQLITASEDKIGLLGVERDTEVTDVYGYQLLAPLLANGDHSPAFLETVGSRMLDFEQQYADEHGGVLPWNLDRYAQRGSGAVELEGLRLDWTQGSADGTTAGWDPMTALMRGLANDAEASRDFFTGDEYHERLTRVDYLLTDREWMVDTPWPIEGAGPDVRGAAVLGDALEAATLTDPNGFSVRIVESIVHEVGVDEQAAGYDNGDFDRSGDKAERFSDATLIDPALVDSLGEISSQYIGSFNLSLTASDPGGMPDYLYDDARFEDINAERFLAELGKDPEAAGLLSAASRTYSAYDLERQLAMSDPGMYDDVVEKVSEGSGAVVGALDFGATAAIHHDSESEDEAYNEGLERGFKIATVLKNAVGLPPLVSGGIDLAVTDLKASMEHSHAGAANAETGALLAASAEQQQEYYRQLVWQSIPDDQLPQGFEPGVDPKEQLDNLDDGHPLKLAYEQWTHDNSYGKVLYGLDAKAPYEASYDRTSNHLQKW